MTDIRKHGHQESAKSLMSKLRDAGDIDDKSRGMPHVVGGNENGYD